MQIKKNFLFSVIYLCTLFFNICASSKNNNEELYNEIEQLTEAYNASNWESDQKVVFKNAEKLEKLIEEHLKENPKDTNMWLKLALLEEEPPLADYIRGIECVKKVISYDPNNAYAAVLLTIFLDINMVVDKECFNILCNVQTNDNEFKAMIEFAKSLYYGAESNYKKSLEHSDKASFFWRLHVKEFLVKYSCDDYYQTSSKRIRANFQVILNGYPEENDFLNVDRFLNEFVRSHISVAKPSDTITESSC